MSADRCDRRVVTDVCTSCATPTERDQDRGQSVAGVAAAIAEEKRGRLGMVMYDRITPPELVGALWKCIEDAT